ncbi:MAG: hypothetical protein B7Y43_01125 [Sphingomonas sp. 28-62-20]|uniref:DUF1801 domain-containing protein n=1 Tax=Sphingomonas sp. 28-62-20 TaxID=1970433 RepID=UPI000BDB64FE|nr:MAG: hypothetical protein B7Y43_01125 [Sphingomonas sp. 28-62-20]
MAASRTIETNASVAAFVARVAVPERRADAEALIALMADVSGLPPKLWGPSIIGFGSVHYRYESGREGDMPAIAFSPRRAELVLYVGASTANIAALLPGLGKHRTGKGCLYVKRLADVDLGVLDRLVRAAWENRLAADAA